MYSGRIWTHNVMGVQWEAHVLTLLRADGPSPPPLPTEEVAAGLSHSSLCHILAHFKSNEAHCALRWLVMLGCPAQPAFPSKRPVPAFGSNSCRSAFNQYTDSTLRHCCPGSIM